MSDNPVFIYAATYADAAGAEADYDLASRTACREARGHL